MYKSLFIFLLSILMFACGDTTSTSSNTSGTAANGTPPKKQVDVKAQSLPSIPQALAEKLFNQCDYIDYVFYTTNFSISQSERSGIQTAISHIATQPAAINPACKSMGRVFYQIDGENEAEADMYFQSGCTYLVFLVDGKPTYANQFTSDGIQYFNSIFQRAQGVPGTKTQ